MTRTSSRVPVTNWAMWIPGPAPATSRGWYPLPGSATQMAVHAQLSAAAMSVTALASPMAPSAAGAGSGLATSSTELGGAATATDFSSAFFLQAKASTAMTNDKARAIGG